MITRNVEEAITRQLFHEATGTVLDVPAAAPLCEQGVDFQTLAARLVLNPENVFDDLSCRPVKAHVRRLWWDKGFVATVESNVLRDCEKLKKSAEIAWNKYLHASHLLRTSFRIRAYTSDGSSRGIPTHITEFTSVRYRSFSMSCKNNSLKISIAP
jgi:hypothetical protein